MLIEDNFRKYEYFLTSLRNLNTVMVKTKSNFSSNDVGIFRICIVGNSARGSLRGARHQNYPWIWDAGLRIIGLRPAIERRRYFWRCLSLAGRKPRIKPGMYF